MAIENRLMALGDARCPAAYASRLSKIDKLALGDARCGRYASRLSNMTGSVDSSDVACFRIDDRALSRKECQVDIRLEMLEPEFHIARLDSDKKIELAKVPKPWFASRTDEEFSLLFPGDFDIGGAIKDQIVHIEKNWVGFRVCGKLEFELVGVASKVTSILAVAGISLLAVSTFDTDYFFVKTPSKSDAIVALENSGIPVQS